MRNNTNYKHYNKNIETNKKSEVQAAKPQVEEVRKDTRDYSYYSRVLEKPFDSIEELKKAEAIHFAELKAKEDKASQKKADAQKVEEAFKALNSMRKAYKEGLVKLTEKYSEDLKKLKDAFEADKNELKNILAKAEEAYSAALKAFTDKYPEGYHITLKDGDFETTISNKVSKTTESPLSLFKIFEDLFW